ncbi:MAG TPA: hypothetical protein VF899_16635 [Pyrinomonadaceae bacterium]
MKPFCFLLMVLVAKATPIFFDHAQRKPAEGHWNNAQPRALQDSSRWSKHSAHHRKTWKNDRHPDAVREDERDRLPPLHQGANASAAATGGLRCAQDSDPIATQGAKIEIFYDSSKGRTTVRLAPVEISSEQENYHSVHLSPSFTFRGHEPMTPSIVDFELQTIVKGRLSTDLYVVFIIDGETVFLSSNRWAIKHPVRGRVWMGERLVFRMPYETFVKATKAKEFQIKLDQVKFSVGETQREALRELLNHMKPHDQVVAPILH